MRTRRPSVLVLTGLVLVFAVPREAASQPRPAGEAVLAWHVTIAPTWFDPSTAPSQITPFGILYALHDALLRPLPGKKFAPSLAESFTESPDGLVYEFKLRRGVKFHNGEPVTAEDAKFSFERYRGAGAKELQARVRQVEIVDPMTVRFHLHAPWPDFLTFYGTPATAAALVVPKKYVTQVGDDAFRKHPIGAGPYKFVSHTPGVEVVLEANPGYWRHAPHVRRLVMKSVPETTTRVAMLKNGEADIAFAVDGEDAENVRRDPRLTLVPSKHASIFWIEFPEQWDPKSPWHDRRLRLAVNHALDRKAINETACLGFCPPAGVIVPRVLDFALQAAPPVYDPNKAKQLLAEAGYPKGLDAGDFTPIPPFAAAEAMVNYINAVGIRVKIRPMERAAFLSAWREKKLKGLFFTAAMKPTRGICALCQARLPKAAMVRHLASCAPAEDAARGAPSQLFHLRVDGGPAALYWMDVEVRGESPLESLDRLLRSVRGTRGAPRPPDFCSRSERVRDRRGPVRVGRRHGVRQRAGRAQHDREGRESPGVGGAAPVLLRVRGLAGAAARLLARNEPPVWPCPVCGAPATLACPSCGGDDRSFSCAAHSEEHACGEDENVFLPVVNSPRMGVCAYTGA